jgi:chaperonin GroES
MEVKSLGNNVLVKILPFTDRKYMDIIHIPDGTRKNDAVYYGIVESIGPGIRTKKGMQRPLDVKLGDKIVFPRYVGVRVEIEGVEFRYIKIGDIVAIIEE